MNTSLTNFDRLFKTKKSCKIVFTTARDNPAQFTFYVTNRLSIYDINKIQVAGFSFSFIHHLLLVFMHNCLTLQRSVHRFESRHVLLLQTVYAKSNVRNFFITIRALMLWNSLPDELRKISDFNYFKKTLY